MPRRLWLLVAAGAVLALAACNASEEPVDTDLDQAATRIRQVQVDMAEVALAQQASGAGLPEALSAIRRVDDAVPLLLEGESIDEGLARMATAGPALAGVDLSEARPTIREVAFAVDRARVSLHRAESVLEVPEDIEYLEATDVVLQAVREFAAAQDALAQVLERHLPIYRELQALSVDFRERRSRFRSADEAADAFSVEARDVLANLAVAQDDIDDFVAQRDQAARDVNEAQAAANAAFHARDEAEDAS